MSNNTWKDQNETIVDKDNNQDSNLDNTVSPELTSDSSDLPNTKADSALRSKKGIIIGLVALIAAIVLLIAIGKGVGKNTKHESVTTTQVSETITQVNETTKASSEDNVELPGKDIDVPVKINLPTQPVETEKLPEGYDEDALSEKLSLTSYLLVDGDKSTYVEVVQNNSPYVLDVTSMPVFYDEYNDMKGIGFGGLNGDHGSTNGLPPGSSAVHHFTVDGEINSVKQKVNASASFDDDSIYLTIDKASMNDEKLFFRVNNTGEEDVYDSPMITVLFFKDDKLVAMSKGVGERLNAGKSEIVETPKLDSEYDSISVFLNPYFDW